MSTKAISDQSFDADVLNASEPVVVDFWAEWCGPCKQIAPSLEEISQEMAEKVTVTKLNVDDNPQISAQYNIRSIPTMLLFKGGEVASMKVGALPKSKIVDWINDTV